MKPTSISSENVRQTTLLAKILAAEITKTKPSQNAMVIGLSGDLGAGKTTFVKALVRGLGVRKKVISPTFIIMRSFPIKGSYTKIYHVDAYRLDGTALTRLGLNGIMKDPRNIVVIEWADRVRRLLPRDAIMINIEHSSEGNERHFTFNRR